MIESMKPEIVENVEQCKLTKAASSKGFLFLTSEPSHHHELQNYTTKLK